MKKFFNTKNILIFTFAVFVFGLIIYGMYLYKQSEKEFDIYIQQAMDICGTYKLTDAKVFVEKEGGGATAKHILKVISDKFTSYDDNEKFEILKGLEDINYTLDVKVESQNHLFRKAGYPYNGLSRDGEPYYKVGEAPVEDESDFNSTIEQGKQITDIQWGSKTNNDETTPTFEQSQALKSAKQYLSFTSFSYAGLIDQLESEYGEGFSHEAAVYAADNCGADWYEQAVLAAQDYLEMTSFSKQGLIQQLESDYGSGFTHDQAVRAVKQVYR